MDLNLQITDIAGARLEYSTVIVNFVAAVRKQLRNSMCFLIMYSINLKQRMGKTKRLYQTIYKLPNKIAQRKYFY